MGNKAGSKIANIFKTGKVKKKKSVSNTDSRSYTNVDAKSYTNIDDRSYTNINNSNLSTNISITDNKSISEIALKCGVKASDVEVYNNNQSINIEQDNSQNIVASGDGNSLENISQQMNLKSYGPSVQKCFQDALNQQESENVSTDYLTSKNKTGSEIESKNAVENKVETKIAQQSKTTNEQVSKSVQDTTQKADQKSDLKQTAGMGSASGGSDILFIVIILFIAIYLLYPEIFDRYNFINNMKLEIVLAIYLLIYLNN